MTYLRFAAGLFVVALARPAFADPSVRECLAESEHAIALRAEHKLRAARSSLAVCAASTCPADVRKECSRRMEETNLAIPTLVLDAKDERGGDLAAVTVTMDGAPFLTKLDGSAVAIDPGEHVFAFRGNEQTTTRTLVAREGEHNRREIVELRRPAKTASAPVMRESGGTQRAVGITGVALGLAGAGLGAAFGVLAMKKHSDASAVCPDRCTDPNGAALWDDARSAGNVSTVAFIAGGIALATGAIVWLTARRHETRAAMNPFRLGATW